MIDPLEHFRVIAETASDAIITIDEASTILFVNPAAERIFGYTQTELLGRNLTMLMPEYLRRLHEQALGRYVENGKRHISWNGIELPGVHKSGAELALEVSFGESVSGGKHTFIGIVRDVSERNRALSALKESEEQTRLLLNSTADAIYGIDAHGHCTFVNASCQRILGYDNPGELLGRQMHHALHYAHADGTPLPEGQCRIYMATRQGEEAHANDEVFWRKDGTCFPVEYWSYPIWQNGSIVGAVVTFVDISEQKQVEEERQRLHQRELDALREAEEASERLSFLAEASQILGRSFDYRETLDRITNLVVPRIADWCAIDLLQDDGTLSRVGASHIQSERTALILELLQRYPPLPDTPHGIYSVLRSGETEFFRVMKDEYYIQAAQDEQHLHLLRSLGISSGMALPLLVRGRALGVLTLAYTEGKYYTDKDLKLGEEIAQRVAVAIDNARLYRQVQDTNAELERRVKKRTEQLQQANREMEAFSYSVSHDLRAPLRGIDGFSRALLEDYTDTLDDTAKSYLRRVITASHRMGELIDDLLELSRLSRAVMNQQEVDLSVLVKEILGTFAETEPQRDVKTVVQEGITVQGDKRLLTIALDNLLGNAWKFTARTPEACIRFGMEVKDHVPTYFVKDNGAGFDMMYANKLFVPFQRLHVHQEFEGTGIGLSTVQRIINRHGGRIWAEGSPRKGATFHFTLGQGPDSWIRVIDAETPGQSPSSSKEL